MKPCSHCIQAIELGQQQGDPRPADCHVTAPMVDGWDADEWLCRRCAGEYLDWIQEQWRDRDRRIHEDHWA